MGLLDSLAEAFSGNTESSRRTLGLLAAAGPTTDPNQAGFGARMVRANGYVDDWKKQQMEMERAKQMQEFQAFQMQQAKAQMAQQQAEQARKQRISEGMGQFFKPGQGAIGPLAGDPSTGILPSQGRAAVAPSFDAGGAAQFLAQNGEYAQALSMMPKPKELAVNKLDVKDFTPASVQKFAQTGNYGDLVRMDKAQFQNTGGATMALDPFTGRPLNVIQNTQSPDSVAGIAATMRGQNMTDARARDRLNFDMQGGADGVKPKLVGDQWVTAPSDMRAGEVRSAMPSFQQKDAKEALQIIQTAREIIPKSTGSYMGAGIDQAARVFGASTGGDTAAAQLKALEGALVSKMPKMSGPQSDKDVLLYKQMAGEIGDPTIPQSRKLAALQVIEQIQQRHSGGAAPSNNVTPTNAPTMRWNPKTNSIEMVN